MADQRARSPRRQTPVPPGRVSPEVYRRRRLVVFSGAGLVVLAVAVLTAFVWPGFAVPEPLPTPTVTVTAPEPTPTISPAARTGEQTALSKALPDVVLALVQQKLANLPQWQDEHDALEAWTVTYADGTGADATTVTLQVGQWPDADSATAFYEAQVKAGGSVARAGDVKVGGKVTGSYAERDGSDGAAVIWWRNGTVVLRAEGPKDQLEKFYTRYPL
jgi:hypothetical protein